MPDEPTTLNPNSTSDTTTDLSQASAFDEPVSGAPADPIPSTVPMTPMPDPQQLVDEALTPNLPASPISSDTATPVPEATSLNMVEPSAGVSGISAVSSVPQELLTPKSPDGLPPLPPLTENTPLPSPGPMADEMPLMFADKLAEVPGITTTTTSTTTPAPVPPIIMPLPSVPLSTPTPPKKQKKAGKILGALLGFFLLAGGIVGGYYYYTNYSGQRAEIAVVGDMGKDECSGCRNGGKLVWRNGRCYVSGTCSDGGTGAVDAIVSCNTDRAFPCGKTPDGSCGGFCINGVSKTCDDWLRSECNFEPVRGANYVEVALDADCPSGFQSTSCTCNTGSGNRKVCYDRGLAGQCGTLDGSDQNGLCAVYLNSQTSGGAGGANCGTKITYYCNKNVDLSGGKSCDTSTGGSTTRPANFCGVIQEDIACQGFKTTIVPCDTPSSAPPSAPPSSPPAPTLACTSLTKDKPTPKIGDKINFTCLGASTPAGSVTLSYQFRYRKDAGAWTTLSATANKASLTMATAGVYDVQCKACGNISAQAKNVCDPIWTGATQ